MDIGVFGDEPLCELQECKPEAPNPKHKPKPRLERFRVYAVQLVGRRAFRMGSTRINSFLLYLCDCVSVFFVVSVSYASY